VGSGTLCAGTYVCLLRDPDKAETGACKKGKLPLSSRELKSQPKRRRYMGKMIRKKGSAYTPGNKSQKIKAGNMGEGGGSEPNLKREIGPAPQGKKRTKN